MRGYRGFFREIGRTGTWRALRMQVTTGAAHVFRQVAGRQVEGDPVERFFDQYRADGVAPADATGAALADQAEACLVCGLCSFECARVGGMPPLDPRDAVVAAARLEVDWRRLGVSPHHADGDDSVVPFSGSACSGCDACSRICPAGIPVDRVQDRLARIGSA